MRNPCGLHAEFAHSAQNTWGSVKTSGIHGFLHLRIRRKKECFFTGHITMETDNDTLLEDSKAPTDGEHFCCYVTPVGSP